MASINGYPDYVDDAVTTRNAPSEEDDAVTSTEEYSYLLHYLLKLSAPRGVRTPPILKTTFQKAYVMAIDKLKELATPKDEYEMRTFILDYVSKTHLSHLFKQHGDIFANMVLNAALEFSDHPIDHIFPDHYDRQDLIGIHKVRGGTVKHSFFVQGVAFKKTRSESTSQTLLSPKILLLDMVVPEHDNITLLQRCKDSGASIILFSSAVDHRSIQSIESHGIICVDQVAIDDMDHLSFATRTLVRKSFRHYTVELLGSCMVFEEQRHENEFFYVFSGCCFGKVGTIVLYDSDRFTETEKEILQNEIMFAMSAMKNSSIVNRNTICTEISTYLKQEAPKEYRKLGKDYQKYMEIFIKSLDLASKAIRDDSPDATHLWEPAVLKIDALYYGSRFATYLS